jgi:hypothetical protein
MNLKLTLKWIAVLALGSVAWVALGLGHSPFDFVGMMAGAVCALFILDCVETATGRPAYLYRFLFVAFGIDIILVRVHVPETASIPLALIIAWKFDDFILRYSAARAIRKLKEKGSTS